MVRVTLDEMAAAGIKVPIVTGAGTGSFHFEARSGIYQEMQCGSYIFMDADYAQNMDERGDPFAEVSPQSFCVGNRDERSQAWFAVLDVGHKALGNDQGMPWVDIPGARYERPSDDHGTLVLKDAARDVVLGEKLRLIPDIVIRP